MRKISSVLILFLFCLGIPQAFADINEAAFLSLQESMKQLQQTVQALKTTVEAQNEVIRKQSIRINALEGQPGETGAGTSTGTAAQKGPLGLRGLSGFNPEIGVAGTVQAHLTEDSTDGEGRDTIALKELELNISQYVDPYSRLDAIIAFNDNLEEQNVDIEEAYYTRWGLPLGFVTQLGKFRSKIGKQNLQHTHQLDTADYALVIRDFFGEEGLASSGVRLQNNIPNPWDIPLEITGEVMRGNNGASFSGISRRPLFNTHAKTYFDLNSSSNLELGWTTLFGDENPSSAVFDEVDGTETQVTDPKGRSRYGVKVYGADATFHWFLSEGRVVKFQNELYFQNRGSGVHINKNPWGFYNLLDYRFSKQFSTGLRFDYLEPLDVNDQHLASTAVSPYFTFWQSEFASFRLQYQHSDPAGADAKSDDAVYLSANFLIGAHKHPVQ